MDRGNASRLARICRQQASLASTAEARTTLLELAEAYEADAEPDADLEAMLPEEIERQRNPLD